MPTVTGLTAARINELVAARVLASPKDVTAVAQAISGGANYNGVMSLGKAYRLDKIVVNRACRLRLYASSVYRTIDVDRLRSDDPIGDHGVIAELIFTSDILSLILLPSPHGYVPSGITYYAVTNDGATGDINITITEQILEA